MHIEGGLSKNECSGVGDVRTIGGTGIGVENTTPLLTGSLSTHSSGVLEKTTRCDEGVGTGCLGRSTEGVDGVGKSVDGISVVERLGTKSLVKGLTTLKRGTVVDVGIGLDNPDKLLSRVVEIELDFVR